MKKSITTFFKYLRKFLNLSIECKYAVFTAIDSLEKYK